MRRVEDEAGRSLTHAQGRFSDGLHELHSLIGAAHSQFVQQRREWIAVAIGVVLGFVVWYPLAFLTPRGGGHWLASTLIGGGRWGAGQTLMRESDPAVWERMVRLYNACPSDSATELCEAAMAVRTIPPGQPPTAPEGARAAPLGTVPPPSHGRAGQGR